MKRFLFSIILFAVMLVATNVLAQDDNRVQSYRPYNWTGFHFGFQGSYNIGNSDWEIDYNNERLKHDIEGGMGGFFIGYNYQTPAKLVVGIESEVNYGRISGSSACPNPGYSCNTDVSWIGSTRGRFGYAIDRFLPYVAIGWAYAGADTYGKYLPTGQEYGSGNSYFGWTPGIGFEFAVTNNLIIRAEYSYYDFFKKGVIIDDAYTDVHLTNNAFKLGLSFKF